jgi:plastocyanin
MVMIPQTRHSRDRNDSGTVAMFPRGMIAVRRPGVMTWRTTLGGAGLAAAAVFAGTAILLKDREAALFAVLSLVALGLLHVRRRLGELALGLLFADTLAFMVTAAWSNIAHREGAGAAALPLVLVAIAVAGLTAAVGCVAGRGDARAAPALAIALAVLVAGLGAAARGGEAGPRPGDVVLEMRNAAFAVTRLAVPGGRTRIWVTNHDLFWHTFTVGQLGIDVRVPVHGRRAVVLESDGGRYEFVCAIPGHKQAGMRGTLVVGNASA